MNTAPNKAHRMLAPRIGYLIGTKTADGTPNLIPVSNLTSISTEPQQIILAVYKQWETHKNLRDADGFTVSVPHISQLEGVWKLGAKYSRHAYVNTIEKIEDSGLSVDHNTSQYGPLLADGIGWATYRIVARLDFGGNHGLYVGQIEQASFNPQYLNHDGTPHNDTHPVMQITGNMFTTAADTQTIPYYSQGLDDK